MRNFTIFSCLIILLTLSGCGQKTNPQATLPAVNALPSSGLTSEVKMLNGVPALYINGELTSQVLAAPYRPDDITMRDDGTPAGMFGQPCHPSLASEKYRELSYKAMVAFLTHVEGKYGKNILGYQPAAQDRSSSEGCTLQLPRAWGQELLRPAHIS